jgi:hypothetical protein
MSRRARGLTLRELLPEGMDPVYRLAPYSDRPEGCALGGPPAVIDVSVNVDVEQMGAAP